MSLSAATQGEQAEPIVSAIEELDRLTDFLNKSLMWPRPRRMRFDSPAVRFDLDELLRVMTDLYEPSMAEKGLKIRLRSVGSLKIEADEALIHRMIAISLTTN